MSVVRSAGLQRFRQTVEGLGGDADLFVHARDLSLSVVPDPDKTPGVTGLRYTFGAWIRPLPQATEMRRQAAQR